LGSSLREDHVNSDICASGAKIDDGKVYMRQNENKPYAFKPTFLPLHTIRNVAVHQYKSF